MALISDLMSQLCKLDLNNDSNSTIADTFSSKVGSIINFIRQGGYGTFLSLEEGSLYAHILYLYDNQDFSPGAIANIQNAIKHYGEVQKNINPEFIRLRDSIVSLYAYAYEHGQDCDFSLNGSTSVSNMITTSSGENFFFTRCPIRRLAKASKPADEISFSNETGTTEICLQKPRASLKPVIAVRFGNAEIHIHEDSRIHEFKATIFSRFYT